MQEPLSVSDLLPEEEYKPSIDDINVKKIYHMGHIHVQCPFCASHSIFSDTDRLSYCQHCGAHEPREVPVVMEYTEKREITDSEEEVICPICQKSYRKRKSAYKPMCSDCDNKQRSRLRTKDLEYFRSCITKAVSCTICGKTIGIRQHHYCRKGTGERYCGECMRITKKGHTKQIERPHCGA